MLIGTQLRGRRPYKINMILNVAGSHKKEENKNEKISKSHYWMGNQITSANCYLTSHVYRFVAPIALRTQQEMTCLAPRG